MTTQTAKARYTDLKFRRDPFLRRARDCATLTIPALMPPEGFSPNNILPEPYQALGSRLVVNLASRLMTALLPPGRNCFRLGVSAKALMASKQESVDQDFERLLVLTERIITGEIESRIWRGPTTSSLEQLIVCGNAGEFLQPDNTIRVYRLDQYVVVRNTAGKLIEFIICDGLNPNALTGGLKEHYDANNGAQEAGTAAYSSTQNVELYTWGRYDSTKGEWTVHQELLEHEVPNTKGTYADNVLPFSFLRWACLAGEDYGRSKVEEHLPDFRTLDGLTKALKDGAAMASRNITLIRPNAAGGINLRRKLSQANNGDYVVGNPEDVEMLQFKNETGLQIVQISIAALREELSAAFLLNQGAVRDAERVTAYEVSQLVQELEAALGGVYALLSNDMMSRRIGRLIFQMQEKQQLPVWPDGTVEPTVLTGLEALSREAQVQNVVNAAQIVQPMGERAQLYVKWDVLLKKAFNGLNLADAVNTEDEVQEILNQQMQTEAIGQSIPQVAGAAATALTAQQ